ncbi:hypothetical protein QN277_017077 [Acacia crassicarpa]|uniref:Neuronal PAS domain protein n=1 Tax=Acacia crassicarpa TaxID=499986 RepID=A0AAE1KFJ3_9FABA|nr:hypothetical protein QN277_017077 [Acacia crassicarpa]
MAYCSFPDVFHWIHSLPPLSQWTSDSFSMPICSSNSSPQPSLSLTISKNPQSPNMCFANLIAHFSIPISLWTSKPMKAIKLADDETIAKLLVNFIEDVLLYGSDKCSPFTKFVQTDSISKFPDIFNLAFLTLLFLVCIYEAPSDLRSGCLGTIKRHLTNCNSRQASKLLMKMLGSNLEEQWMRSLNLAITNWIAELQAAHQSYGSFKTPSPLFSYAFSTFGLWKIQLYCPVISMDIENSTHNPADDERLQFSLKHHQVEGVFQLNYRVTVKEKWIDIMVNTDNIRCDVVKLVSETLMRERGAGAGEKHFPSRIFLQLTPTQQSQVLSVSVAKSSENPRREIGMDKSIEASLEPPNPYLGLKVSAGESTTVSLKPWKFEQSVYGYSANLNWFLHDSVDGKEVFSSKPSKIELLNPKSWFKDRYSSAYRPFTRQGGVIFAGDEYGESVRWKVDRAAVGKTMEWEIRGWVWLTYWPNKHKTLYNETRTLQFREMVLLNVA